MSGTGASATRSPFPGRRPYAAAEDLLFFGRAAESERVADSWRRNRVTILHGPAGVGKTSLLSADVLTRLRHRGRAIPALGSVLPDSWFPAAAFPVAEPAAQALLRSWTPGERPSALAASTVDGFLGRLSADSTSVLAALDQAENLFRTVPAEQRGRLLSALNTAVDRNPAVNLLFSVRDSHLPQLLAELPFPEVTSISLADFDADRAGSTLRAATGLRAETIEAVTTELTTLRTTGPAGTRQIHREQAIRPAILQVVGADLWREHQAGHQVGADGVTRWLAAALWDTVCRTAETFDRDPGWLCRWLADRYTTGASASPGQGGMPAGVLRALLDDHVLDETPAGFTLAQRRLLEPLVWLAGRSGSLDVPPFTAADRLRAALRALVDRDRGTAERQATAAAAAATDQRQRVRAEILLGNLAFDRDDFAAAERHYEEAAVRAEATHDRSQVGALLAAAGRLRRLAGDPPGALRLLQSASNRMPGDPTIRSEMARAFSDSGDHVTASALRREAD